MLDVERDPDIEWLLTCAAVALGERGTWSTVTAIAERGTVGGSGQPNTDFYSDQQIGWDKHPGDVARARRLTSAWHRVEAKHQDVLIARYGCARDTTRVHIMGQFGALAGVALFAAKNIEKLLKALERPYDEKNIGIVAAALERAKRKNAQAHKAWAAALADIDRVWVDGAAVGAQA